MIARMRRAFARSTQAPITVRGNDDDFELLAGDALTMERGSLSVTLERADDGSITVSAKATARGEL